MERFELTAYAKEEYKTKEECKKADVSDFTIVLDDKPEGRAGAYGDTVLPFGNKRGGGSAGITFPPQIREMIRLYEYGDGSLPHKARNFYRQGRFMEDYEDDVPWQGEYKRYFSTYHDLNIRQLRGYFTWRTQVRKGLYQPIAASFAYMYLYELLCGIGTDSVQDTLDKLGAFEEGYLDSGIGDAAMRHNLHRWMFEYAVLHGLPPEKTVRYADSAMLERDRALAVLKKPGEYGDEEVFEALSYFGGKRLSHSYVLTGDKSKGKHLFAAVWRNMSQGFMSDGKGIFAACFGKKRIYRWYPLSNAVYYEEHERGDTDYILNECRSYHLRGSVWREKRYDRLYFDKDRFRTLIRGTDRLFRRALKTGHYLNEKPEEDWVVPYVEAVIKEERQARIEAARPRIEINFSSLPGIRKDSLITRDSLLTEEEEEERMDLMAAEPAERTGLAAAEPTGRTDLAAAEPTEKIDLAAAEPEEGTGRAAIQGLDALHLTILRHLMDGQSIEEVVRSRHLMVTIVTETINEALFDEIGDNVLECDGDRISVLEDYREDIEEIMGGSRG